MGKINNTTLSKFKELESFDNDILRSFFNDEISLLKKDYSSEVEYNNVMNRLIALLTSKTPSSIVEVIKPSYKHKEVNAGSIPQFSDISNALYTTPEKLANIGHNDLTYAEMGRLLWQTERLEGADMKYGENHAKTAAAIGLVSVFKGKINLSSFGKIFLKLNPIQQAALIPNLWLNVPLFYNYFCTDESEEILKDDISILSESTQKRRLSNIKTIIDIIKQGYYLRENNNTVVSESRILNIEKLLSQTKYNIAYLTAMRTKPFLLLAGISGTGKSRIVKQMAFESCPNIEALRKDPTSPGNYQLIEVKPNWHDSTEVLGYESEIGGSHYVATPFVKFLVKAMQYEDKAPFFVCMDEMNLAPVEQYFAEFLSVLESRKLIDGKITSEPLIKADIFKKYESSLKAELFNLPKETATGYDSATRDIEEPYGDFNNIYVRLKADGLRIPSNLIVVGTVNMDETTHQFSRKVIDRAMTIEMNIEDAETPFKDFFEGGDALHYYDNPQPRELFLPKVVQAADALSQLSEEDAEYLKANVPQLLYNLNKALDGTPFKIAYRVQNELVLYFYSLREEKPDTDAETLLASAMDAILMMKVLPRIEGDEDLLEKPLKALADFTAAYPQASKKIAEMQQRLPQAHFTSFWP